MAKTKTAVKTKSVKEKVIYNTPKRYYVDFYRKHEPLAKDEKVGTIFYSDTTESIKIEGTVPNYDSDVRGLLKGDIMFMDGPKQISISPLEKPKEWLQSLHKVDRLHAVDINTFLYASEAVINNETE